VQKTSYLIIFLLAFAFTLNAQNKYVGVKTCGMCHKKANQGEQLKIWEGSAHAKAFKTLQSAEADKIAAEKGLKTKAAESPKCLKCHVTGYGEDASLFDKKFSMEDGVQCEACHGPGSKYKSSKTMKDQAKAVAAGLIVFADDAAIKTKCETCHNDKSPTFKEFDFKKMWDKIKHPVPKKG
jgi:hypothetical protein